MHLFAPPRPRSWTSRSRYEVFWSELILRHVPSAPKITLGGAVYGAEKLGAGCSCREIHPGTLVSLADFYWGLFTGPNGQ